MKVYEAFKLFCEGKKVQFRKKGKEKWINCHPEAVFRKNEDDEYEYRVEEEEGYIVVPEIKNFHIEDIDIGSITDIERAAYLMLDIPKVNFIYSFDEYTFNRDEHNVVTVIRKADDTIIFQDKFSTIQESDEFLNKIWGWE